LAADDAHRLGQALRGQEETAGDELGYDVGDADGESEGAPRGPPLHDFHELAAEGEDLVRVAVDDAPHLREDEPAPFLAKELLAQGVFQRVDLGADRRVREAKLGRRRSEPALARHRPEVEKMVVVEPTRRHGIPKSKTAIAD